ncbi:MAG: DUF1292 domain-containing protein [Clostridia bacterium]
MPQEYENIVTMTDEDGNEIDFEILDVVPYDNSEYAVLLPVDCDEAPEAVILEILSAEDDEDDELCGVTDEAVLNSVFALFIERNRDEFQFQQ